MRSGQPEACNFAPQQQCQQHGQWKAHAAHPRPPRRPQGVRLFEIGLRQAHRAPGHQRADRQHAQLPQQDDILTVFDETRQAGCRRGWAWPRSEIQSELRGEDVDRAFIGAGERYAAFGLVMETSLKKRCA